MTHKESLALSAYLDGELDATEKAQVAAHLSDCSSCRQELSELEFAKKRLAGAARRAMPPELIAAIEAQVSSPWRWLRDLAKPVVLVPAGVLAAAAVLVGVWFNMTRNDPDQYIPLAPLLAAHSRYSAEALVPSNNLATGSYSQQLTDEYSSTDADASGSGQE